MRRSMALPAQLRWRSVCIWMAHNTGRPAMDTRRLAAAFELIEI
jgi:hypothetical protein